MAKKNAAYWKDRFLELETASNAYGHECFMQIEPSFDSALRQIESQIDSWYGRFAKNNQISMKEARILLNSAELKELRWDVKEYIKYGHENDMNPIWMKELENASAKYHISRLEALKIRTQQAMEVAFGNELDAVDAMARKVFSENYYHSIFEMQKGFGVGWDVGQIDERKLEKLIQRPWAADGKNFSERIWESRTQLVSEVHNQLTRTCILGKAPDDAIKHIAHKFNVSKNQAGRLVMTEQAYFHAVSQEEAFKDLDVEEFEIVATLDSHTSEICQEMDGKHFPMKEYEAGVTAPPFHPWCRSVTVPYFEDNLGERAARGEDGKTYYVPSNMTYPEWKKSLVDGDASDLKEIKPDDKMKVKIVNTIEEARKALIDDVGFDMIEDSFNNRVNPELAIEQTNQLIKLEKKFGAVHKSTHSTICSESSKGANAYVSSGVATPGNQHLSLCPGAFKNRDNLISGALRTKESGWHMPFIDEKASVYTVTHEYGHIIENILEQERMISLGWDADEPMKFVNYARKTTKAMFKWYYDISKQVQKECFDEIIEIAKEANADFSLADNLSRYGHTNRCEFFAEVFANSQLGEPNELGKAMNVWLERKGLIQ